MSSHKSSICPDIPSEPLALFGVNLRMSEAIFSFSIGICSIFSFVKQLKLGKTLSLITGLHCREKKSVRSLGFFSIIKNKNAIYK